MDLNVNLTVDARNMNCPLPVLKMKKGFNTIKRGEVLELIATDPTSVIDVKSWCHQTKNEYISDKQVEKEYFIYIKRTT